MKNTKTIYWIVTILFAGFMLLSAIPDILKDPKAMQYITALGYPEYFVPFLSWAKVLGVIAILVPGFPKIREWAYAGFFFDLVGAIYSITASGHANAQMAIIVLPIIFLFVSYGLHHKMLKQA